MQTPSGFQFSESDGVKKETTEVGLPWRIFLFSLLIAVTSIVAYLGLEFGYKPYLNSRITNLEGSIDTLIKSIPKAEQDSFLAFYSQLANLQGLLSTHTSTAMLWPILESSTNTGVYYGFVDFRLKDRRLNLEGIAVSYEALSQQLEAFNQVKQIEQTVVNESQAVKEGVKFRLFLILKPEVFETK